jgi:hypothetical protein
MRKGLKAFPKTENDLQIDVKLFTILYANDTVLLAESVAELHSEIVFSLRKCF